VVIADTGNGIGPEMKSRIFDAFFTTKGQTGTGLGLWISADIIQKHSGTVRVKSRVDPGKSGTVFSIFLPQEPTLQKFGQPRLEEATA
jgi:signal transduction histidine kinase